MITLLDSTDRGGGIFSQLEWLGTTAAATAGGKEEGVMAAFLRRMSLIQVAETQKLFTVGDSSRHCSVSDATFGVKAGAGLRFTIRHSMGDVTYRADAFLRRNRSLLFRNKAMSNIALAIRGSTIPLVSEMVSLPTPPQRGVSRESERGGDRARHVACCTTMVENEVSYLVQQLDHCESRFICCVNPNHFKIRDFVEPDYLHVQLAAMSITDTARLHLEGFPVQYSYTSFFLEHILAVHQPFEMRSNPKKLSNKGSFVHRFREAERVRRERDR